MSDESKPVKTIDEVTFTLERTAAARPFMTMKKV
tara:strand:+ start:247 stop:348 length:102 start_codon:yes stop_codon:yes gene_type:complete